MSFYILQVHSDVEPEVLGPYPVDHRDKKAKELRTADPEGKDSLFMLDIDANGNPEVNPYAAGFFE